MNSVFPWLRDHDEAVGRLRQRGFGDMLVTDARRGFRRGAGLVAAPPVAPLRCAAMP
jgi:hypothetical protein